MNLDLLQIKLSENLSKNLVAFIDAKKREKVANEEKIIAEKPILAFCQEVLEKDALLGQFNHSYKVISEDEQITVMFITTNKFTINQKNENIEKLKKMLVTKFSTYIEEQNLIEVKLEVFTNKQLQNELIEMLGDKFSKFFDKRTNYIAKDDFNENIYKFANGSQETLNNIKSCVSQNKSFLK